MPKPSLLLPETRFTSRLLLWHRHQNTRQMPWKGEADPYRIWLSEIILQQTRVEQGMAYYERFLHVFPTIGDLAAAPDEKVFKLWEGLGYYSRCRNLLATARFIAYERNGAFPDSYEAIRSLKGVGPYTAAAIASFAYGLPYAVVDGNVFRVLSRVYGIRKPIDSTAGKKYFTELAGRLLDKKRPGAYNQAIMDFGAVVCKPVAPLCGACTFRADCVAHQKKLTGQLPVKEKKTKVRRRWLYYLELTCGNKYAVQQRTAKDIWQGLYEFPLVESDAELATAAVLREAEKQKLLSRGKYRLLLESAPLRQQLSHQLIQGRILRIAVNVPAPHSCQWVTGAQRAALAFPRFISHYLERE